MKKNKNNNNKYTHILYYPVCIMWYGKKEHFYYAFAYWFLFWCRKLRLNTHTENVYVCVTHIWIIKKAHFLSFAFLTYKWNYYWHLGTYSLENTTTNKSRMFFFFFLQMKPRTKSQLFKWIKSGCQAYCTKLNRANVILWKPPIWNKNRRKKILFS